MKSTAWLWQAPNAAGLGGISNGWSLGAGVRAGGAGLGVGFGGAWTGAASSAATLSPSPAIHVASMDTMSQK